ncbi:MAG: hypothetical protein K2N48_07330, partial [Muribaculaceae bacterium]|nr:hypothetical protein [Muribaculaceae bacterium]
MGNSILPSGEVVKTTPEEILRYLNPDGLRQMMRQERLRWNLKPNRYVDYIDQTRQFKYNGAMINDGRYQLMEIRTYPDNGAYAGYAGVYNDSGILGLIHNLDRWDHAITSESLSQIVNRTIIGAMSTIPGVFGYGMNDRKEMTKHTDNRLVYMVFDPYDGRAYLMSNDDPHYVNNETRSPEEKLPWRTVARIGDIPTRITD